jgi:hypothetical protein
MGQISKIAIFLLVVLIFVSFFLPWINVGSPLAGGISKVLTGKKQADFYSISGFQVPILANGSESRLIISVIQLFNLGVKDADKKSWLIWAMPGLAVIMLMLLWLWGNNRWLLLVLGIMGVAIFGVATFKILTTNLDKLVLKVTIAYGLWALLTGYLLLGGICLSNLIKLPSGKGK